MDDPITELDERFSDPGATATPWADARAVLESAQMFWISTTRRDGRPHMTPLVAVWHDGAMHFCTGADEQKAHNLSHDQRVILSTGCNEWDSGLDVMVEGVARRVTDQALLEQLAAAWSAKWDGRWRFEVGDGGFRQEAGDALVFAVDATKVLAFAKGTFTHTRYLPTAH